MIRFLIDPTCYSIAVNMPVMCDIYSFCLLCNFTHCVSLGHYDALEPQAAFKFIKDPSVGQIALAFLQASFAYSGWNFLNYVTEELVEPRK